MEEKLTKKGFLKWLESLDVAPYSVMFFDIPKFVQYSYIQKWLREVHKIEIAVQWFDNCYIKAVAKKPFKANTYRVEGFQSYEECLEIALQEALNLIS